MTEDSIFRVTVEVWDHGILINKYIMNHNDVFQRRVLGEQCRNAFEGGQRIVTYPTAHKKVTQHE